MCQYLVAQLLLLSCFLRGCFSGFGEDHNEHRVKCRIVKDNAFNAQKAGYAMVDSPTFVQPAHYKYALPPSLTRGFNDVLLYHFPSWTLMSWFLGQPLDDQKHHRHCIDIGSGYGMSALHMSSMGCYTHAFEVSKESALLLNYDAHASRLQNHLRVHMLGLSDRLHANFSSSNFTFVDDHNIPLIATSEDCIPHHHNISLVRIDVDGHELPTLRGLTSIIEKESIDAIQIAISPQNWGIHNGTTLHAGAELIHRIFAARFTLYVVAGSSNTACPKNILPDNDTIDIALTSYAALKHIPWSLDQLSNLLGTMASKNYQCHLWLTRGPIQPSRLLEYPMHFPLLKYLDGKAIQGTNNGIWYAMDGKKRLIPNWDTFLSMKLKQNEIVKLGAHLDFIPSGSPIPPV